MNNITYRTINLRHKVTHSKHLQRLTMYWCNVIKTRELHRRCYPGRKLRLIGFDQKPLYHCAALDANTLDLKGEVQGCCQRVCSSLARAVHNVDH